MASPLDLYRKYLSDTGQVDDRPDRFIVEELGGYLEQKRPDLLKAFPDFDKSYRGIREANAPGELEGVVNTAKSAYDRSVQAMNTVGGIDAQDAKDIAEREKAVQNRRSSTAWENWQTSKGRDAVGVFLKDPIEILSNIVTSGFAGSLPSIAGGIAGGAAGAGAGSVIPVVGTAIGGVVGAGAGAGAGSLAVEYGNKYLDTLREAGVDLTDADAIIKAVSDPELNARAKELGLRRGIPVAAFDAVSAGLAGKFLGAAKGLKSASAIRHGLAEAAIQGGLGGAGEVAGALTAGEKISPGAVFEEVVGELGPGAVEVGAGSVRRRMAQQAVAPIEVPTTSAVPEPSPVSVMAPVVTEEAPVIEQPQVPAARRVALMTPEEQKTRYEELTSVPTKTPDQQQEFDLLEALVGGLPATEPAVAAPPVKAVPVVESEIPPAEVAPPSVLAPEVLSPGTETPTVQIPEAVQADRARYDQIQTEMVRLTQEGKSMNAPEVNIEAPTTPQFQRWFGGSKMVDEQGKPRVVYHGTISEVASPSGLFWTTPSRVAAVGFSNRAAFSNRESVDEDFREADQYSPKYDTVDPSGQNVMPVFVSIKKPLDLSEMGQEASLNTTAKKLSDLGVIERIDAETLEDIAMELGTEDQSFTPSTRVPIYRALEALGVYPDIKKAGYDGVKIVDTDVSGNPVEAWASFEPTQVKSAIGNRGTFDPANPDITLATEAQPQPNPVIETAFEADRTEELMTAAARLAQAGAKVDVFSRTFLQTSVAQELQRRMDALTDRYMAAPEVQHPVLQARIEKLQAQLDAVERVRGVTYSPTHLALGLNNVEQANTADLVTLLHEGAHAILAQDPAMQARVIKAVNAAFSDLQTQLEERQSKTGFREVINGDPEELIVAAISQKLALEGVPDSATLAQTLWQWVKDLYYRIAMGVQAAFGREPISDMAIDWFENQMRRIVGGDFDWRFAHIFNRVRPEPMNVSVQRQETIGGTPGGLTNYFDSLTQKIHQPEVLPDGADAIDWNLKFATEGTSNPGAATKEGEQAIPYREASARISAAATNELSTLADTMFEEAKKIRTDLTFDQWWAEVHGGQTPQQLLGAISQQVPGAESAQLGGERMTSAMDGLAAVQAKILVKNWLAKVEQRDARSEEATKRAEKDLVSTAQRVNKVEAELRNAEMHEATLSDRLKEDIRNAIKSVRRGLDTAFKSGELMQAVRDAENLAENEGIPSEYQKLFQRVLNEEIPIFDYIEAIAKLDLPLSDLSTPEIRKAIEDNAGGDETLSTLTNRSNRPLLVALSALVKRNYEQVDMLLLRRADKEKFLAIHGDLKSIREATVDQLRELEKTFRTDKKAKTFADRLKQSYIQKRAKLRHLQETIQTAERRRTALTAARTALQQEIDRIETENVAHPSEWRPHEGATYLAMYQDSEGKWRSKERTLRFTREGPAVDAGQLLSDMVGNREYLRSPSNEKKRGTKLYQTVERQVAEISNLDVQQVYPESRKLFFEKWLMDPGALLLSGGGAAGARAIEMLKKFQFITFSKWQNEIEIPSLEWANRMGELRKLSGLTDDRQFLSQVYDPVISMVESEPGLEEGPALREAVRAARRRLGANIDPAFDEKFKDFLRRTKALSETFVRVAEENGVFIQDDKLGGELRRAVARGWLTVMRRMDSATVSTVLGEMDRAGWRIALKDGTESTFDEALAPEKAKIARSTTFDSLLPDGSDTDEAKIQVLENSEQLSKALSGLFTPGIVKRWLEPFVNKPGESVFTHEGESIDQLDVQQAWQDAGGTVVGWIDKLGERVGLTPSEEEGAITPEAEFRVSMLKQLGNLYVMEARMAAETNQVRNLFDPEGRPAHLLMDSRDNDLLPPEHIQHMAFTPKDSQVMLATLAFHGAFGRNGEAMNRAIHEIEGNLNARKAAYQSITGKYSTKAAREQAAKEQGYIYKDLKNAAKVAKQVQQGRETLVAAFGFGNQAGVLGDVRGGLELLHFMANQTTNNPKTGLLNLLQPSQRAIARRSLGPVALRDTGRAYKEITKQFMGGFMETFGLHLMRASQHAKEIGAAQGQGIGQLPWTEVLGVGTRSGRRGEEMATPIKAMRSLQMLQRKGARVGFGESREFIRQGNVPFFANMMQYMGQVAANANAISEATSIEGMVKAAMDHFVANPDDLRNPTFRLTAKDLGMQDKAWFADPGSFDYYRRMLVEYGIGNLEQVARDAMDRQTKGQPILTKDQVLKTAVMSGNELDLQSSINTNPGVWSSNPILKFATPLLGWPIRQMSQIHSSMRDVDGRASVLGTIKAAGILAAWSLPIGLAFTFLTDEYDDKILKKKTNLGNLDPISGIPVIGPALALASSDDPMDQIRSMGVRLSRAGNIYGLGADMASTLLSGLDPTSGQRQFSLDSRILAFSQIMNLTQAIGNWINSGFATTFSNFYRPLMMSVGGSGALHAIDVANGVLGIDNQEARMTARTNASQWLRSAGKETGLEIRRGGGASTSISPMGAWTREMALAALGGDRLEFLNAYRRAVEAAREDGRTKPEQAVLESFRSRSPIEVFRRKPTQEELRATLNAMSVSGREAVTDALRMFHQFEQMIAPTSFEQRIAQRDAIRKAAITRARGGTSLRKRLSEAALVP